LNGVEHVVCSKDDVIARAQAFLPLLAAQRRLAVYFAFATSLQGIIRQSAAVGKAFCSENKVFSVSSLARRGIRARGSALKLKLPRFLFAK